MPKKNKKSKTGSNYPIGKQNINQVTEKKSEFYHKHKNTIWTVVVLVILTLFFIVNNTRKIPEQGPYPPNFLGGSSSK